MCSHLTNFTEVVLRLSEQVDVIETKTISFVPLVFLSEFCPGLYGLPEKFAILKHRHFCC